MKTVTCPKCNNVLSVLDGKDYVVCCGGVIFTFMVSDKDFNVFTDELINPSEPNQALKDATVKYKKITNE